MNGKTCIITGASDGIGLETARRLGALGARLVLVGHNRGKGEAALARLRAQLPGAAIEMRYADLALRSEVVRVASELLRAAPRVDVLVNNAGAFFARRMVTPDGLEQTFALNHMGYVVLTELLLERLAASAPARIVNVASEAHRKAALDFADLQCARSYSGWKAYQRSKLCNILFTRALAQRLAGTGVTANCLHPGFVATSFGDNNSGVVGFGIALAKRFSAISVAQGAETPVYVASAPALEGITGRYFDKCKERAPSAAAQDEAAAARLWQESRALAGLPSDS
ncbi:MAG TPA: SDR family oxidoreductase [Stellaceae bacterium]|nr:SDR family oxidoreductase [Stellaceae bacterium]